MPFRDLSDLCHQTVQLWGGGEVSIYSQLELLLMYHNVNMQICQCAYSHNVL